MWEQGAEPAGEGHGFDLGLGGMVRASTHPTGSICGAGFTLRIWGIGGVSPALQRNARMFFDFRFK